MATGATSGKVRDRKQVLLSNTQQRRCRLQGLQDASLHYGWAQHFCGDSITIEVVSKRAVRQGDFLYVEVSAPVSLLTFVAYVTEVIASEVTLQVTSEIEERALISESRIRVRSFEGEIVCLRNGSTTNITVVDVSENGFGFISQQSSNTAGPCNIVLKSVHGDITLSGDVRHSRSDKESGGVKGGVLILEMDRVSRARWVRLVGG